VRAEVLRQRAIYNGLTPRVFGEQTGQSTESVYGLIHGGWFGWTKDMYGNPIPECQDTRQVGAKHAQYRIHTTAVARWFAERAVTKAA
jgi:hypothetical protein